MLYRLAFLSIFYFVPSVLAQQTYIDGSGTVAHYEVQRANSPITIDGRLDEYAWEPAAQINQFERILNNYDSISASTRAKMLWDDEYFYFAFTCTDRDMWTLYDKEDDRLWEEEVVEVFIDPDGDGRNYLELEVSPTNTVVDLAIYSVEPEFTSSVEWDIAGLKTAVQTYGTINDSSDTDTGWSVEIAIPWSAMAKDITGGNRPAIGDNWRLNLYRIERKGGRQAKAQMNALSAAAAPIRTAIAALWKNNGLQAGQESQLNAKTLRILRDLEQKLEPLQQAQEHFGNATEYTAWSETYQRGFHHPARFGVVHFTD
ncbi:MAG: hypothetical protein ACI906_001917 [Candidatus Latescibacterota bacterium]|jgi:hypothetical protein